MFAELLAEGRPASRDTAEGIVDRLEAGRNYIPSSEVVRREYARLLLLEYKDYVAQRESARR